MKEPSPPQGCGGACGPALAFLLPRPRPLPPLPLPPLPFPPFPRSLGPRSGYTWGPSGASCRRASTNKVQLRLFLICSKTRRVGSPLLSTKVKAPLRSFRIQSSLEDRSKLCKRSLRSCGAKRPLFPWDSSWDLLWTSSSWKSLSAIARTSWCRACKALVLSSLAWNFLASKSCHTLDRAGQCSTLTRRYCSLCSWTHSTLSTLPSRFPTRWARSLTCVLSTPGLNYLNPLKSWPLEVLRNDVTSALDARGWWNPCLWEETLKLIGRPTAATSCICKCWLSTNQYHYRIILCCRVLQDSIHQLFTWLILAKRCERKLIPQLTSFSWEPN